MQTSLSVFMPSVCDNVSNHNRWKKGECGMDERIRVGNQSRGLKQNGGYGEKMRWRRIGEYYLGKEGEM